MIDCIDETVLIQFSVDDGETWEDFDSGESFNDALVRTLEICQEDEDTVLFQFKDAMGCSMAILGQSRDCPDVFILTYSDRSMTPKYYKVLYVEKYGRVATSITSITPEGIPIGPPVLI
jgi:hypothetical protein